MNEQQTIERVKRKWDADMARTVADGLIAFLKPCCDGPYLMAAGSLRRGKWLVGDVEILYVPKIGPVQKPGEMFASEGSLADVMIEELLTEGKLAKRVIPPPANAPDGALARICWGPMNKLATHRATGMPVDLFATTKENWFVSLVIRTGPAELNIKLAVGARLRGLKLHAYGTLAHLDTDEPIYPQSEREVFELCGVRYQEPDERN